jgi:2-polyprenyl-3-methyl-5-hydroxy-6-metoxy-1,4-benzoquinol methylase
MEPFFPSLKKRYQGQEEMDRSDCDPRLLDATIGLFARINPLLTGSRGLIVRFILEDIDRRKLTKATLIDIGAGGCDLTRWLVQSCRKRGVAVTVTAVDHDPRVIAVARKSTSGFPEITIVHDDWTAIEALGPFDYAFSNHLLHHLEEKEIVSLFTTLRKTIRYIFLMNDLRRSGWAYGGYYVISAMFLRRSLAHRDGLLSIRKGFTKEELTAMTKRNDSRSDIRIIRAFPARLAIVGKNVP